MNVAEITASAATYFIFTFTLISLILKIKSFFFTEHDFNGEFNEINSALKKNKNLLKNFISVNQDLNNSIKDTLRDVQIRLVSSHEPHIKRKRHRNKSYSKEC